ncbi:MAG: hypothetical protein ACJA08_001648 [Cyclobacteriaceae bacterium]|jgi:hypothetical protein
MDKTFLIFGKAIRINSHDRLISDILEKELSIYPSASELEVSILIDHVYKVDNSGSLSSNPSIHFLTKNGFIYGMGPVVARFYFDAGKVNHVQFSIQPSGFVMRTLRKWMNIQFTSHKEAVGQWLHEHILVPLAFTDPELSVIHASAVQTNKGKTLVFGGTGGVGKTSLEITLCRNEDCSFIADDICIMDKEGSVYPNLAYPKIYAYNIEGNHAVKKAIFKGRGAADKIHFKLHELRGKKFIRRRISPEIFYGKTINTKSPKASFFILFRDQSAEITFEKITTKKAAYLNALVISREYNGFFDHLVWNEYNAIGTEADLNLSYEKVIERGTKVLESGLSVMDECWLVRIPSTIAHTDYQTQMVKRLKEMDLV